MPFGIYVHIPYCLQICTYCDFVKFEKKDLPPTSEYTALLLEELRTRASAFLWAPPLTSIYFGGGTPSLLSPDEILSVLKGIANAGFKMAPQAEITLEINPGTIDQFSLEQFIAIGVNRFSVGAQTFDESALKLTGRKHSVEDTVKTLELLSRARVNYSFDLLFGLPRQTRNDVKRDVFRALEFGPSHLSAYNLTVPKAHWLNAERAGDDEQAAMFEDIEAALATAHLHRYEVSNFATPGRESKHNFLYWSDAPYWGIGIGSHSYIPRGSPGTSPSAPWGARFWNAPTVRAHKLELARSTGPLFWTALSPDRTELLKRHEALTDFAHTSLRSKKGLSSSALSAKFGPAIERLVADRLRQALNDGFVVEHGSQETKVWILSKTGQALADRVFSAVTFLHEDLLGLV